MANEQEKDVIRQFFDAVTARPTQSSRAGGGKGAMKGAIKGAVKGAVKGAAKGAAKGKGK